VTEEQWQLSAVELAAWRESFRAWEHLRLRIERQLQAASGLSNADYTVLAVLSEAPDGRLRAYELGETLGWEKSRLHHQLTRMGDRGMIVRERCGSRGIDAVITAHGLAVLTDAVPAHSREVRRLFVDPLSSKQLADYARISSALIANLER
jgi:DNA-binding MarR family transcriptional regulator